jgi:hypothetical protein
MKPNSVVSAPFSHFAAQNQGGSDGREVQHGVRQTKTKPVWHTPCLTLAPCHPSAPLRFFLSSSVPALLLRCRVK